MRIALLAVLLSGCGYAGMLRMNAVDAVDRRAERTREGAVRAAKTLLANDPSELPGPDEEVELIDLTKLNAEDAEALARRMYETARDAAADSERSRAWLACLRDDLGAVDEADRVGLGSDAEHAVYVQYAGVSGARAWHLKQWRAAMSLVRGVQRFARRTYAVVRWCLYGAVVALSSFGLWQWLKQRRERKARREAMDVIDGAKRDVPDFDAREATADKRALKAAWERDRGWRTKRAR